MYGAVPDAFKNIIAARKAAESYALENNIGYVIMTKICDPDTAYEKTWYKPVDARDIETAKEDGYCLDLQKYGCHCDIMDGEKPDETCAIDTKQFHECTYAEEGGCKEHCEYWRVIE